MFQARGEHVPQFCALLHGTGISRGHGFGISRGKLDDLRSECDVVHRWFPTVGQNRIVVGKICVVGPGRRCSPSDGQVKTNRPLHCLWCKPAVAASDHRNAPRSILSARWRQPPIPVRTVGRTVLVESVVVRGELSYAFEVGFDRQLRLRAGHDPCGRYVLVVVKEVPGRSPSGVVLAVVLQMSSPIAISSLQLSLQNEVSFVAVVAGVHPLGPSYLGNIRRSLLPRLKHGMVGHAGGQALVWAGLLTFAVDQRP
mmetsp:Transcript_41893/g.89938  ORF Transcript_41893/g.89938 Transcript_41893/m.89938 type:complete len:255 (+) Transcript_41893:1370-2134(+)